MIVITTKKQEMSKRALKSRLDRGSINFLEFASKCSDLQRKVSDSKDIRALEALFIR